MKPIPKLPQLVLQRIVLIRTSEAYRLIPEL